MQPTILHLWFRGHFVGDDRGFCSRELCRYWVNQEFGNWWSAEHDTGPCGRTQNTTIETNYFEAVWVGEDMCSNDCLSDRFNIRWKSPKIGTKVPKFEKVHGIGTVDVVNDKHIYILIFKITRWKIIKVMWS